MPKKVHGIALPYTQPSNLSLEVAASCLSHAEVVLGGEGGGTVDTHAGARADETKVDHELLFAHAIVRGRDVMPFAVGHRAVRCGSRELVASTAPICLDAVQT